MGKSRFSGENRDFGIKITVNVGFHGENRHFGGEMSFFTGKIGIWGILQVFWHVLIKRELDLNLSRLRSRGSRRRALGFTGSRIRELSSVTRVWQGPSFTGGGPGVFYPIAGKK